ncbi:DUF695 domain-containing protein [Capnocytophaga gingivalis]|uniref:DUF695 domain-containing protein n=1 Tax=Capnocytophaga gingivalis TaxID=1017 RepID=UPI002B4AAD3B|nr:DUF695 domain-containing protein [Capnocytophaga gingivalis]MEB3014817.1 DUF695 domain-containing protein [Capnocytophaga gingivalis]
MNNKNLPQNWDFFMCRIEGAPASIRTNLALIEVAPLEGLTQRLQFYIKMENPRPDGLSSNEEYPILCDIEDALGDKAEAIGAILAGVVKSEGFLELWFYTQNAEALAKTCEDALQTFEGYQSGYNIAEDPEWEDYFDFLYPDEFSYQTMQNRKVLMQLEKNGDKMEVPREIDHFIYFKEAAQQQAFAKEAEAKGFKVRFNDDEFVEDRKAEGKEYPYMVEATREDSPLDIDDIVWDLLELASPFEGDYDGWGCANVQ